MTDLISREALLVVPNVRKVAEYDETGEYITYFAVPEDTIKNAPAVDAVEVVRCKDCKHRGDAYGCPMYFVLWHGDDIDRTEDEGFCADGARMDGENNEAD